MRRSFRTRDCFTGYSQGYTLGWYAMPRWGIVTETWCRYAATEPR